MSSVSAQSHPPRSPTAVAPFDADILIVGAGPVGLALAGMLAQRSATAGLSVLLVDARSRDAAERDPRVLALSHGSHTLLAPLGWPTQSTPIEMIHVSQRGYFGRTVIDHRQHRLPALGHVVRYGALTGALHDGVERIARRTAGASGQTAGAAALTLREGMRVQSVEEEADGIRATLVPQISGKPHGGPGANTGDGEIDTAPVTIRARLIIHAEGSGPGLQQRDYQQTAIVGAVCVSAPQPRVAWERFTGEGPLALLPLAESGPQGRPGTADAASGNAVADSRQPAATFDYALVWCQSPANAQARMALDDATFLRALHDAFGDRVGTFTRIAGRATFELGLRANEALADGRAATIGNAAQTLHPVAGQGLNLGVRDAQALALAIGEFGPTPAALHAYAQRRSVDRRVTIGLTDAMARGFTIPFAPLAHLRGAALAALDCVPGPKAWLARQMMFGQRR